MKKKSDPKHEAKSSCAQGLVSHALSDRLSSRPKRWLDPGLKTMNELRVYRVNGGRINE